MIVISKFIVINNEFEYYIKFSYRFVWLIKSNKSTAFEQFIKTLKAK